MKPFLTAITAICALGAGITGTLLWVETRPNAPVNMRTPATPTALPGAVGQSSAPDIPDIVAPRIPASAQRSEMPLIGGANSQSNREHEPPAGLTSGMSPPEAALTLGNWSYDHEQWALAIKNYRSAIENGVDNPNIRTDLGNALRFSDRPQEALQQYQRAQKQDPTHEQSLFNQGALYAVSLKQPQQGIKAWKAYLKRFPDGNSAKQAHDLIDKFASEQ